MKFVAVVRAAATAVTVGAFGWMNAAEAPSAASAQSHYQAVWKDTPEMLRRALRPVLNLRPPSRDEPRPPVTAYFFVHPADERVLEVLEPLLEWRRRQGYKVVLLEVPEDQAPAAQAQWCRDRIAAYHHTVAPVEYVCLVGDAGGEFSVPAFSGGLSDYPYGLLNGSDPFPEAAMGRLSFNTLPELERMVAKILAYEREMDGDAGWTARAAVAAGSARSGYSTILVSRWARDLMLRHDFATVDTFWWTMGAAAGFLRDQFDAGRRLISYRGWTGVEGWSPQEAARLANRRLPVAVLLGCNTGDYAGEGYGFTEGLLRARGGAIGALGTAGAQGRVDFNNALLAGFYRGAVEDGVETLGWLAVRAKLELMAAYPAGLERVSDHVYWTNLMGDPATPVWSGAPRPARLTLPQAVSLDAGQFTVTVTDQNNRPLAGVRVGAYKPGELSAADYTDPQGRATLRFDPVPVSPGAVAVTASGADVQPVSGELQLQAPARWLTLHSVEIRDPDEMPWRGNGDGIPNPNEAVQVRITVRNRGNQAVIGPVDFTLRTDAEVCVVREAQFRYNGNIGAGANAVASFGVELGPNWPDREAVPFEVDVEAGGDQWTLALDLSGAAPRLEVVQTGLQRNPEPGGIVQFTVTVANTGTLDVLDVSWARLVSESNYAEAVDDSAAFDTLRVGDRRQGGRAFTLQVDDEAPWGTELPLRLDWQSTEYRGSARFTVRLAEAPVTEVTGPDAFGYWAIETRDGASSNLAPAYDWIELDPAAAGPGEPLNLRDYGEDQDRSQVVDLPFVFRYYGQEFQQLTVCTNGWAALGDQRAYVDFRNTPIGAPQGPRAQICPWWDDLYQADERGGVFYWYDQEYHRFIVEWSRMRRYVGPAGPGAEETFQLILCDPQWHPTYTGDGDIIFQYATVNFEARVDAHGTPYPTVGIGTPDDHGGLQLGFWDRWSAGAGRPPARSAVRFATSRRHFYATVKGTVRAAAGGAPVAGAVARVSTGGWTQSGADGAFRLSNALADVPLSLTVSAPGYNPVTRALNPIRAGDSVSVNVELSQPQIAVNRERFVDTLDVPGVVQREFAISNIGNGELEFRIAFEAPEADPAPPRDEMWRRLLSVNVTAAVHGDHRILGAAWVGDRYVVSGGNNGAPVNYLYYFDGQGRYSGRTEQPVRSAWGMHDLAWDGRRLYGGSGDWIYRWDLRTGEVDSLRAPYNPARALAVDPVTGEIWTADLGQPIVRLDAAGRVLASYSHDLSPYGLAWKDDDDVGGRLWILSNDGPTHLAVTRLNPETGRMSEVGEMALEEGDRPGGCELTTRVSRGTWALVTVVQNPDADRLEVLEAGLNLAWVAVEPQVGTVEPMEEQPCQLTIISEDLPGGDYAVDMVIHHNAAGAPVRIPVRVFYNWQSSADRNAPPEEADLAPLYPNPANGFTRLWVDLPRPGRVAVEVLDLRGAAVKRIDAGALQPGRHLQVVDVSDLPSGVYVVRIASPGRVTSRKLAVLR